MPLSRALRLVRSAETVQTGNFATALASPSSSDHLARVVATDMFGAAATEWPLTRSECMSIPAVARARHKLVAAIARAVVRLYAGDTPAAEQPAWMSRTDGRTSPQHRLAWTVDDLIFGGWSLWAVTRAGTDPLDPIEDAARAPWNSWQITPDGEVQILDSATNSWVPVEDDSSIILIPGYHEGLLEYGTRTLRQALALEETAGSQAANPIPAVELHQTDDTPMSDDQIDALVDAWQEAIQESGGAVAYTPRNIEVRIHGNVAADLLIQGRNAAAIDAARAVGLPASTIDASNVNSTLTYETAEGRNLEFRDDSIALYADPIAARLSMDDVCPPGTRVALDFAALTTPTPDPAGPARED